MKITVYVGAMAGDAERQWEIRTPEVLSMLDGCVCIESEKYPMASNADWDFAVRGLIGGVTRCVYSPEHGLELATDYWIPETLVQEDLHKIAEDTLGQHTDGVGEGGYTVRCGGTTYAIEVPIDVAFATPWASTTRVEQVNDGRPVPPPAKVPIAAASGDVAALRTCLAEGADVDGRLQGFTGLHLAIGGGHRDCALLLIAAGADVNAVFEVHKTTALMDCALCNAMSDEDAAVVASQLIAHGADISLRSNTADTAEDYALNRKKSQLLRVLQANAP
jgi:hypothetical protein